MSEQTDRQTDRQISVKELGEKIRIYLGGNPKAKNKDIAAHLGISTAYAGVIKSKVGLSKTIRTQINDSNQNDEPVIASEDILKKLNECLDLLNAEFEIMQLTNQALRTTIRCLLDKKFLNKKKEEWDERL